MTLKTMTPLLALLIFIISISLVSATETILSASQTSFSLNPGGTGNTIVSYSINNANGLAGSKGVVVTGSPRFLSYSGNPINFNANTTTSGVIDILVSVPSNISEGEYINYVTIDEQVLQFTLIVSVVQASGCRLIELPHTTNFRIKQGETGGSNQIRLKVSTECHDALSMSVAEQTQMSKPMFLQGSSGDIEPGEEFSFSIGLDATGVNTGAYQNTYIVSGDVDDQVYEKRINLLTIVTLGDSPIDENTFSNPPTCNLPADMQLNQTYSLVCNNENLNIGIEVPYNPFFEGIAVVESEGRFEYKLKPKLTGNTEFIALFKFKDSAIGEPFSKQVRITRGSLPILGTKMEILFYQEGIKKNLGNLIDGNTDFIIRDNSTLDVINEFDAYLNGKLLTNSSFDLGLGKEYEFIIYAPGYQTENLNITVSAKPIHINITPETGDSATTFFVTTDINATIYINGESKGESYLGSLPVGEVKISAFKEGYLDSYFNLTIEPRVTFFTSGEFKKGVEQVVSMNKNASWEVYYQSDPTKASELILSGEGPTIKFTPNKKGTYIVKAEGSQKIFELEGFNWGFKIWKFAWYWWILGVGTIAGFFVYRRNGKGFNQKGKSTIGFGAPVPNYGGGTG